MAFWQSDYWLNATFWDIVSTTSYRLHLQADRELVGVLLPCVHLHELQELVGEPVASGRGAELRPRRERRVHLVPFARHLRHVSGVVDAQAVVRKRRDLVGRQPQRQLVRPERVVALFDWYTSNWKLLICAYTHTRTPYIVILVCTDAWMLYLRFSFTLLQYFVRVKYSLLRPPYLWAYSKIQSGMYFSLSTCLALGLAMGFPWP